MRCLVLCLLAVTTAAWAAETGSLLRAAELKQKPFSDAAAVSSLPAKAPLEILRRQGAWMQVQAAGQTGWVKLLNVRTGSGAIKSGSVVGGLSSAMSLFKTGSSGTTVTTGVKGLSEEDLRNAQPNLDQLAKLKTLGVSATDAGRFAREGKLQVQRDIGYLSEVKPAEEQ